MGMKTRVWVAALSAWLVAAPGPVGPSAQPVPARPKLVVVLVVDQLRTDYLTDYAGTFSAGLQRLIRQGAWFKEAAYPYLNTVTCAGHATIGTGTFPYQHGMILNAWLDRSTGTAPACTDDGSVKDISYVGLAPGTGDSARRMLRPALAEQIRQQGGRTVTLSLKPRSAIPLAGKEADAVVWFDDRGGWSTSSAFADGPVPFVKQFIDANPLAADLDKTWDRTLEPTSYKYADDLEGEGTPSGWTRLFPHPLASPGGKPDTGYFWRWQRSPYADEYLGRMAAAAVDALELGRRGPTDFLAVSFSTLDMVGHAFGPRSHEVQDVLVRLDRTIGRLLEHLDRTVGAGNYVLGLSSDHGVAEVPEQAGRGGRQPGRQVSEALARVLSPVLGLGPHVVSVAYTDIYLSPAASQRLIRDARLRVAAVNALRSLPAIERVFRPEELDSSSARSSSDPVRRAAALSYHPERSGDLIIVPRAQWLLSTAVTTHGTHHAYDQRVPVVIFGASVKPGEYAAASTPADIVPTLADVAGVRIARTDGRSLREALTVPAPR